MASLIQLSSPTKYVVFPFLIPVFIILRILIITWLNDDSGEKGFKTCSHPFIIIMFMFIGEFLNGILELISIIRQQPLANRDSIKLSHMKYPVQNQPKNCKSIFISYFFVVLAGLIDFINMTGLMLITTNNTNQESQNLENEMKIIQIIFTATLSYFILKLKVFKHQFLSIFLIIIGIIMIICVNKLSDYSVIPYYLLFFCLSSGQEIIEKWAINARGLSPFKILFTEGLVGIILCLSALGISSNIKCQWKFCKGNNSYGTVDSFTEGYQSLFGEKINILYISGYVVLSFGLNISSMLTSFYFTPTNRTVSDSLASFFYGIILLFQIPTENNYKIPIEIIAYCIITFACLVYNEIIIFKCCNLDENTYEEIRVRSDNEILLCNDLELKSNTPNKNNITIDDG